MKLKITLSTLLIIAITPLLVAQTHTWTGNGGDTNWFISANWDAGTVPDIASDVFIPDGFVVEVTNASANANTIELEGSAELIVDNNINIQTALNISLLSRFTILSGTLSGAATIENDGTIYITGIMSKTLLGSTINNNNKIIIENSGFWRLNSSPTINNAENASFEIIGRAGLVQDDGEPVFNNEGLVKKSFDGVDSSFSYMIVEMNNNGVIDMDLGESFLFISPMASLNNSVHGILKGYGDYDITGPFNNLGIIYPGDINVPGTIIMANNFSLNPEATIELDINGPDTGAYDVLRVVGFPDIEGTIEINLNYAPEIGDEYTIITANEIQNCDLPVFLSGTFNSNTYNFAVFCNTNNVTLRMVEILGVDDLSAIAQTFFAQPNPIESTAHFVFGDLFGNEHPNATIEIYNYLGQQVRKIERVSEENNFFERKELASGLYFAQLTEGNNVLATTKLLLK